MSHIESLRSFDGLDILQTVETEGVGIVLHVGYDVVVEAFGVHPHDVGGIDTQRAVDKDIDVGK